MTMDTVREAVVSGQLWRTGDAVFIWLENRVLPEFLGGTLDFWVEGKIEWLSQNGRAGINTYGRGALSVNSVIEVVAWGDLRRRDHLHDESPSRFPAGSRIAIIRDADNIKTGEVLVPRDGDYVYIHHDDDYDGGWFPWNIAMIHDSKIHEPRNNDGRQNCFWCGAPTRLFGMGFGHVCTRCGK
jgi:hypothetical protein